MDKSNLRNFVKPRCICSLVRIGLLDYSQENRQKKEKREDSFKEKFFMGGGIIMLEKRNYVQIS